MLEIAILGLLNESPMHGYELRKRLSTLLGAFRAFSYGSLYPTLRRLQQAGWIDEEAPMDTPAGHGPSGSGLGGGPLAGRSRRGKRVYKLTAEGKEHFATLLAEVGPSAYDDEGFGTRLAFFAQTRSEIRLQILEGRRQRMAEQADGMRTSLVRTRARMDRYTLQLQEHGLESADREVRWLNELIENERSGPSSTDAGLHRTEQ
jgi:DNA-binding PadR family transcriptional regulator